ncbi:MAG: cardiolipin synthase A [Phycisphaerae bacterium]|nr:MAG: cardiolipin synthase A [Phycisphaerae bacterium]
MPMDDWKFWASTALVALDVAFRLVVAFRVIVRRCPVSVTLSWLLVLLFLPFVSGVLYLLVGEPRLGSRRAAAYERATRRIEEQAVLHWTRAGLTWTAEEYPYTALSRLATATSGMPALRGNDVELLGTGAVVLRRLVQDIDAAIHHVHLLYYIWQPGGTAEEVAEALIRAAGRGVECRVLVDAVGSKKFLRSETRRRMTEAGVRVVEALPVSPWRMLLARADLRNHRKIAVIDASVAYCGSQNLTDESFKFRRRKKTGPWIDATVRLRGPAVQALQTVFVRDWLMERDRDLRPIEAYFPPPSATEISTSGSPVHVVPSGPGPQAEAIHQAMLGMLLAAREEIILTTPYFVPDEATKAVLINAALRGVEVTLVLPDVLDAHLVAAASRAHYEDLLMAGIRIVHHEEGLLHAKTATIDRSVAMLGSANFDVRSFWLNFEATLFVYDEVFASQLRFMQQHYANEGSPVTLAAWKRRRLGAKVRDNLAQLLSPLL